MRVKGGKWRLGGVVVTGRKAGECSERKGRRMECWGQEEVFGAYEAVVVRLGEEWGSSRRMWGPIDKSQFRGW